MTNTTHEALGSPGIGEFPLPPPFPLRSILLPFVCPPSLPVCMFRCLVVDMHHRPEWLKSVRTVSLLLGCYSPAFSLLNRRESWRIEHFFCQNQKKKATAWQKDTNGLISLHCLTISRTKRYCQNCMSVQTYECHMKPALLTSISRPFMAYSAFCVHSQLASTIEYRHR